MKDFEQEVAERAKLYQTDPEESWKWLLEKQGRDVPANVQEWFEKTAIHVRDKLFPTTRENGENIVDLYPIQLMWGYQSRLGSGYTSERIYNYYYGTFGTGYMFLTDQNCYILISPEISKKCPLYEKSGFISSVLKGVLGEREEFEVTHKRERWVIPRQAIKAVKVTADFRRQECIELVTDMSNFLVYPVHDLMVAALQMTISGRILQILGTGRELQTSHDQNQSSLRALQEINSMLEQNLISRTEYEAKKAEILSRL